jgi:agmatine deiminase
MKNLDCDSTLRMPAEWEKQEAIWLAWPHNKKDWPGKFEPIPWVYAEIIRFISLKQRVRLIVKNTKEQKEAIKILTKADAELINIDFFVIPTDRAWLRDSMPTFVYRGKERVLLNWHFNAWAKYNNWTADDKVALYVAKFLNLPLIEPHLFVQGKKKRIVLEGGAIEVNGKGSLITTEECFLSDVQCRNPGFTKKDYEKIFAKYFGASNIIWLKNGVIGDDTHGHIDDLARFVDNNTVVTVSEKNKNDKNYQPLQENLKRLKKARDQNDKQLNIVELPMPKPVIFDGSRLPASYANFLITNNVVLVPLFNDSNDRLALNIMTELFPKRTVTGIYSRDFVWGLGTIHCASQQELK